MCNILFLVRMHCCSPSTCEMVYCVTLKVMQDTNTCKMIGQLSVYHILVNQSDLLLHSTAACQRSVASRHVQQRFTKLSPAGNKAKQCCPSSAVLCSSVNVKIPPFLDKSSIYANPVSRSHCSQLVVASCSWSSSVVFPTNLEQPLLILVPPTSLSSKEANWLQTLMKF